MEANDFVARLKADKPEKYNCDLRNIIDEYKCNLSKIAAKDRGLFGLNVLRTLCWNIEKAPKWRDSVDNTALLSLAIECVRDARTVDREDRIKTLACIYHMHRYAVRLNKPVQPELILKISFMPFELDSKHLLKDYHKTYWNILSDRLTYIERLKTKANILKVLPKLTEDIGKVIQIYDTTQFCTTILTFLVKKLHSIFSDIHAKELSNTYRDIFTMLSGGDLKAFKELKEREIFDIYMKLNDCLYIVADNSSKLSFKDGILDGIVHTCISLISHNPDLFHCHQTFYLNFFCSIVSEKTNATYVETIFGSLENSLQTAEKLGYKKAMNATYPYLNQLLRLYIEWQVANASKTKKFTLKIQESCLKLILFFMIKLEDCDQILKCENCSAKTGLHDSLRLSFLIKHFITTCLSQKIVLTTLFDTLNSIIKKQYEILIQLETLKCANYQKYYRKLQTDIHNSAINLNKAQYFEFSINLFEIYLRKEFSLPEIDSKNITRALFNKSICELDSKLYEEALVDAFLSLIFAKEEGLKTDKYMSLVMDVKAKELKSRADDDDDDNEGSNALQLVSVLDACKKAVEGNLYGDLKPFISQVKFSAALQHEFDCYGRLWPSLAPVGGVWRALRRLPALSGGWRPAEDKAVVAETLYRVVLETPAVVRTIHSDHYSAIVRDMLDEFHNITHTSPDEKLVLAALLFLQCEYSLAAAGIRHDWKITDTSGNPDDIPSNRTLPQEFEATTTAIQALDILQNLMPHIHTVSKPRLRACLQIFQIFVPLLLHLSRDAQALQLAYLCVQYAELVEDHESYLRNAGFLLAACTPCTMLDDVISRAGARLKGWGETQLIFLCDLAVYYIRRDRLGMAARLVAAVQTRVCDALINHPDVHLELAVGRLLELQVQLCRGVGPSDLTAANAVQRHYLAVSVNDKKWCSRRLRQAALRVRTSAASLRAVCACATLGLAGRARAAAAHALLAGGAGGNLALRARVLTPHALPDKVSIDNHLKRILGLQLCSEVSDCGSNTKQIPFTPKQEVETMRDVQMYRKTETSPSLPWLSVAPINIPDFFYHNAQCLCYACQVPLALILTCRTASFEAQIYDCADENKIARNYYQGFLEMAKLAEAKLEKIEGSYEKYEGFIAESVAKRYKSDFRSMYVESLIQLAFFELKLKNFAEADRYLVEIHESLRGMNDFDPYLSHEVMNLMAATAKMKETIKKPDAEMEFDNCVLTPAKIEKTPEKRPSKPPKQDNGKIVVKDEEIPKKRSFPKMIKLDDVDDEDDFEKPVKSTRKPKKDAFKVPNPIIPKSLLEEATPKPLKTIPKLFLTQPSTEIETPNNNDPNIDFFTPANDTPEQFFTPMTSVKTYTKKSLRQNIVKNLQQEFSTPNNVSKENRKMKEDRSSLKENKPDIKEDKSRLNENKPDIKEDKSRLNENKPDIKEERSKLKDKKLDIKEDRSSLKENKPDIKENKREVRSNTKSKFVIKEDEMNELSSNLKSKLNLKENSAAKEVKVTKKLVTPAVKEDRSIRRLNSKSKEEPTEKLDGCSSKENKTTIKEDSTKKSEKEGSRSKRDRLVRAASPGKLEEKSERDSNTRTRRVRQINLD